MPLGELTAAASRYISRKIQGKGVGDQSWQSAAYDMYHRIPEVRFAASWIGNAMGGARLYAGRRADDGSIEPAPTGHRAAQIVAEIAGGPDGQTTMLKSFGKHLTVPGEGWIIVRPNSKVLSPYSPVDGHDWRVLSVKEVHRAPGKMTVEIDGDDISIPEGDPDTMHPDAPVAIRVWEPDPERAIEADSAVRSSMEVLGQLVLLNAVVDATAQSRLTGRGVLLMPKGARFPSRGVPGEDDDDLIELFMEVAETAIREPKSAAATVPLILEVPGESIADMKYMSFESPFDELALKLRDEAIRRFATGLEIPAEIVLGMGDVNHWGSWALTDEAITLGIEPKLATVAYALTQQWLRPILEAEGDPEWHRWMVWYDTSQLRQHGNNSETSLQVHDRDVISDAALRRETGFQESDAPTPQELAVRAARRQATTAQPTPTEPDLPVDETHAPPALPTTEPTPDLPASATPRLGEGLLAAADGLIWGALTAAGEKLLRTPACPRSERGRSREVPAALLHTQLPVDAEQVEQWRLLDGAWFRVDEIATRYGLDPQCLTAALDSYARELIAAGVQHEYRLMPSVLTGCVGAAA